MKLRFHASKIFLLIMIRGYLLFSTLVFFFLACQQPSEHPVRKEMPLRQYNFHRESYDSVALRYLMGNAEMGGLVDLNGLGFDQLWFTDLWEDSIRRKPLDGFRLVKTDHFKNEQLVNAHFDQVLDIKSGVLTTKVESKNGVGYETEIFFSKSNKHLLVFRLKDLSDDSRDWVLTLPEKSTPLNNKLRTWVNYDTLGYSKYAACHYIPSSIQNANKSRNVTLELDDNGEALILLAITTEFDDPDYQNIALEAVSKKQTIEALRAEHLAVVDKDWDKMGSIILPESDYAKWFYRSLYFLMSTAGADHFLPGEMQFSIPTYWDMHAFTYGHAGWSTLAFASLGHREKANKMAQWHYQPEALRANVNRIFPFQGTHNLSYKGQDRGKQTYLESLSPLAMAFGHELTAFGDNVVYEGDSHWDWQRQLDGFAASMFHILNRLYPDPFFEDEYAYPVLKGTAELWSSLVVWDNERGIYYLPPLLSVSENIMENSVLDAVLAARWNLMTAAEYAEKKGVDKDLSQKWRKVVESLAIPQNEKYYLEFLDDPQKREGGGYFGIRAAAYLGYPAIEQIPYLDKARVRNTLDNTWERNLKGKGMISFVSNWFALTEALYGNGEMSFQMSNLCTKLIDQSEATMGEALIFDETNAPVLEQPYFLTGYSSLILVPIHMMLQSHQDDIRIFPAMTKEWQNAAFYDLPALGGLTVSAEWESGKPKWIVFKKDEKIIKHLHEENYDFNNLTFDYLKLLNDDF
ncbi:MAG: hypothetical protein R8N23_16390 [Reichenbachiella sp.]|uniref:glycoside hydrolase family 95-like protein n=1 Tax=Reichenbachiella sp. TaxID=2184521 RepID=UPI00296609FF|nr:hypothetical protein [Reichenbachiella sp.]MDW3211451.1 hypothetical protein [Reichenbachiella sp.]